MEGSRTVHGPRGLLAINKPKGITSYDVIRRIKKIIGRVKIGHTGTLDPFASGVLLILLGEATKINRFLDPFEKEYEFEMVLGIETDTLDMTGDTVREEPVPALTENQIESALSRFTGRQSQVPPRFSAVYINGQRAYKLAAKGIEFEPEPRMVDIHKLELLKFEAAVVTLKAVVGTGTYIRALARDLGKALESIATVRELKRNRIGQFELGDTIGLDGLSAEIILNRLVPINSVLDHLPSVTIKPEAKARFLKGQSVRVEETIEGGVAGEEFIRVRDREDSMLVIGRAEANRLKPYRLIYADH
jgi:tRNA pseudouridine55 synthase